MSYRFKAPITIDHTKVSGTSDLSNFPMLFSDTYDGTGGEPDLRTVANGGNIENTASGGASGSVTVPADLAFYSDEAGTTPLDFEIESYNASTGEINAWVEMPTLDVDADTEIWMHYSDSGVTTSQENVSGTWNSNYVAVYHFASDASDSTSNGRDGTVTGATLQSGGGYEFTSTDKIIVPNSVSTAIEDGGAIIAEIESSDFSSINGHVFDNRQSSNNGWDFGFGVTDANPDDTLGLLIDTGTQIEVDFDMGAVSGTHFVAGVYTGSEIKLAVDGNYKSPESQSGTSSQSTTDVKIGNQANDGDPLGSGNTLRRIRFMSSVPTEDWIKTEYNSQNSPSTFYSVGDVIGAVSNTGAFFQVL